MTHQRSRSMRELNSLKQRNQRGDFYNCVITSIGPPNMSFLTTDFDFYETMTCICDREIHSPTTDSWVFPGSWFSSD